MKTSKSNNVLVSQSSISALPFWPSNIDATSFDHCAACGRSLERQRIGERLTQAQRDARSITRAVQLMVFLSALAVIGLAHSTVFLPFWPQTMEQYLAQGWIKAHCVLGLASFSCAIAFSRMRLLYRRELQWCVEQYQRFIIDSPDLTPIPPAAAKVAILRQEPVFEEAA